MSTRPVVFNLVNCIIGVSVLAMPFCLQEVRGCFFDALDYKSSQNLCVQGGICKLLGIILLDEKRGIERVF